jgi:hypothetical protein
MIPKPLADITEADVEELQANGVEERTTIEYKRDLPGTTDEGGSGNSSKTYGGTDERTGH